MCTFPCYSFSCSTLSFPYASLVAYTVKHLPSVRTSWVWSSVGKIPWRKKWQPTPLLLPAKFHGLRSLEGYSPWGLKEWDMTEQLHFLSFLYFLFPLMFHKSVLYICISIPSWLLFINGKRWYSNSYGVAKNPKEPPDYTIYYKPN